MKKFRTLYGTPIPNVIEYIKEYIAKKEDVEILIGSDSQCYGNKKTIYGVVIALYSKGKGAHVLCTRETKPIEKNVPNRLLAEVWMSIEVAEYLKENDFEYPVSINGKVRAKMLFPLEMEQSEIEKAVLESEVYKKWSEGLQPKKFIVVKGRIINVVL